jgi:hypothetical protein
MAEHCAETLRDEVEPGQTALPSVRAWCGSERLLRQKAGLARNVVNGAKHRTELNAPPSVMRYYVLAVEV